MIPQFIFKYPPDPLEGVQRHLMASNYLIHSLYGKLNVYCGLFVPRKGTKGDVGISRDHLDHSVGYHDL